MLGTMEAAVAVALPDAVAIAMAGRHRLPKTFLICCILYGVPHPSHIRRRTLRRYGLASVSYPSTSVTPLPVTLSTAYITPTFALTVTHWASATVPYPSW
jgi:hypothetical protein